MKLIIDQHVHIILSCSNYSGLSTEPTFRGLSAESKDLTTSLDPADKPRDVGREKVVTLKDDLDSWLDHHRKN